MIRIMFRLISASDALVHLTRIFMYLWLQKNFSLDESLGGRAEKLIRLTLNNMLGRYASNFET
jgi:hypothetical protein